MFNPLDKSNGRRYDLNAFLTYDSRAFSSRYCHRRLLFWCQGLRP